MTTATIDLKEAKFNVSTYKKNYGWCMKIIMIFPMNQLLKLLRDFEPKIQIL